MSYKEINVTIRLGNAAMSDAFEVADALRRVAEHIEDRVLEPRDSFRIYDVNGNTVGRMNVDRIGVPRQPHSADFDQAVSGLLSAPARMAVVKIGAVLGAVESWNGGDVCEQVAYILDQLDLPAVDGIGTDDHRYWARIARDLGYAYDDPDDDDEDYDAEMDDREGGE